MSPEYKDNLGFIEGWLSIVINTILFVLKFWVGLVSGSIAMVADAWHTLSDSITSMIVLAGFWMSRKRADKEHPFGHGRAETIGAIIVAVLLFLVGVNFIQGSILKLKSHQLSRFSMLSIIVFIVSAIVKEALARFSMWAGRKIDSKSLLADGWHHRSDAVVSAIIVVGIVFGKQFVWLDGVMGIFVSVVILYAAYNILRDASGSLLGEKLKPELEKQIKELAENTSPLVCGVHHLHMHRYGDHREITLHIRLPDDIWLKEAHKIASRVDEAIKTKFKIESTIHMEPLNKSHN